LGANVPFGSFNPEPTATVIAVPAIAVGSALNELLARPEEPTGWTISLPALHYITSSGAILKCSGRFARAGEQREEEKGRQEIRMSKSETNANRGIGDDQETMSKLRSSEGSREHSTLTLYPSPRTGEERQMFSPCPSPTHSREIGKRGGH
jgi:hypothetical protein